jgi:hypothetical protein
MAESVQQHRGMSWPFEPTKNQFAGERTCGTRSELNVGRRCRLPTPFSRRFFHGFLPYSRGSVKVSESRSLEALEKYLIVQVLESEKERFAALCKSSKRTQRAVVFWNSALVAAADRSIVAMLSASPGASKAAWIMLRIVETCFAGELKSGGWFAKLKELIPSYGQSLIDNPTLCQRVRAETAAVLNINNVT